MKKNTWLALLICLNVALLGGVILAAAPPQLAHAQGTGLAGNYLAVAGQIQGGFDALYILDTRARFLHAFFYDKGQRRLFHMAARDLERDFRQNRGGG